MHALWIEGNNSSAKAFSRVTQDLVLSNSMSEEGQCELQSVDREKGQSSKLECCWRSGISNRTRRTVNGRVEDQRHLDRCHHLPRQRLPLYWLASSFARPLMLPPLYLCSGAGPQISSIFAVTRSQPENRSEGKAFRQRAATSIPVT